MKKSRTVLTWGKVSKSEPTYRTILILSKCFKNHVKKIQQLLINFLNQRGLTIENPLIFQGKHFKSGSSINYLGFKFISPNLNKLNFNQSKYINVKYRAITRHALQKNVPYVLVQYCHLKNLKDKLKIQLNKTNSYLSVANMIDKINLILRNALNYYNITAVITLQLLPLDNLLHKLFYKYLFRKYSSTPKIYSYLKVNFINQNKFKVNNKVLLRVLDFKSLSYTFLMSLAPSNSFLMAYCYVDQIVTRKS